MLLRPLMGKIGIPRASTSFEVNQILENYLPTIFATLVEPFWVLLNRLRCVLQPFKDLGTGKARPAKSMETTYTSIPPQLVLWRAIKNGHFVLVMVCVISLLGNVLAVGLSALFNEKPVLVAYPQSSEPGFAAKFNNESVFDFNNHLNSISKRTGRYTDHMYIAMANISSGNSLPAWVSPEYFFQPHRMIDSEKRQASDTYSVITQGFGARVNCTALPARTIPVNVPNPAPQNETDCGNPVDVLMPRLRHSNNMRPTGQSAIEHVGTLTGNSLGLVDCDMPLLLGWGRTPTGENENGTIEASFAVCYPVFETAKFNVTVDRNGLVHSYKRVGEVSNSLGYPESKSHTDALLILSNYQMESTASTWHNDTLARDYISYLSVVSSGSRTAIDPAKPLPDPADQIPFVESIYRLLFATILGLNQRIFESEKEQVASNAVRFTTETKIFTDGPAFIITMVVLGLNIVGAAVFYATTTVSVLPRMPTTIGSILAYVAPSRAIDTLHKYPIGQHSRAYSFGRYLGLDGEVHVGIELAPHVTRVDRMSLKERDSLLRRFPWRNVTKKPGSFGTGTWL